VSGVISALPVVHGRGRLSPTAARLVGERLRQLQHASPVTAQQLADAMGISRGAVFNAFNGKMELTLGMLVGAVHVLGLRSIEELISPLGTSVLRREDFGLTRT
jgi:transcriptional regulator with XRE-family HTH domain